MSHAWIKNMQHSARAISTGTGNGIDLNASSPTGCTITILPAPVSPGDIVIEQPNPITLTPVVSPISADKITEGVKLEIATPPPAESKGNSETATADQTQNDSEPSTAPTNPVTGESGPTNSGSGAFSPWWLIALFTRLIRSRKLIKAFISKLTIAMIRC
jgi:hypothetical protein